ncbi:leucine-rich repeat-containing protein 70-like [Leguminivora glycinivorella]|uniref:leucine-rich repeat-containing protein 70-like n=1 Tax=Leguminivora glycinivorella TaxID=1035111 RepID=UPI0020105C4E|nr:leucine-rich repeat-containing protein 70-like [Leguminivora glycinivorella]
MRGNLMLEMNSKAWIILLAAIAVKADPTCTHQGTDIVCTNEISDYILKRGLVSEHSSITGITLRNCRITHIELESFHKLPALEYLDLSVNKISRLELGVLDGFKKTIVLNISHNRLTEFPLGVFDQKPNLEILDLKGNRLENLELGVFDPLHKLRHLDLSSNKIKGRSQNPYIFDQSTQIKFMDFSRNDMSGTPENMLAAFEVIDFLNLDRCSLSEVPKFATRSNLRTMKHLLLSTNEITKLDNPAVFSYLENLEKLNLVANYITEVHQDVFKPLKKAQEILLSHNKMVNIPETLFQNMRYLTNIDLSNNFLENVPVNAFRGTKLKVLNLSNNRFTYLQDNFNLELRNSGVKLSHLFFQNNPWQCACLNDILVEIKKYEIHYNGDKYDGRRPVCVTNEFACKRQPSFNEFYSDLYDNVI